MKTNPSARWIVRIRITLLCLVLVSVVAAELVLGQSVAARVSQLTATQNEGFRAPDVDISNLMAAMQ